MKRIKKLLSAVLVSTFIIGTMAMQAFAYNDGDREVLYYNFTFGNGELVQTSSSSMKRLYNREWVVTVDSVKNNRYGITYGIFDNNASEWYNSLVSYTTSRTGTGNFGGRYYGSDTVGRYLYLGAMIDERDVNRGVVTSGQWSTDASK
jgi:hypothetical protein